MLFSNGVLNVQLLERFFEAATELASRVHVLVYASRSRNMILTSISYISAESTDICDAG